MNINKLFFKSSWVLALAVLLLGVPRLSGAIASLFDYQVIDPDGAYAWISVHHIAQALIFLMIIAAINRFKPLDFGFGWGDKRVGKQCVLRFALFFGIYTAGAFLTVFLANSFQHFAYPLTATNIIGQMGFQLLLSGPSEELIFRAFAMTMLVLVITGRVFGARVSHANIIAAVIFALAHVAFSLAPLAVSYDPMQLILATVLGLFYGDCYERTKSMYYPMMMHSISNVMMVGAVIVTSLLLT
jgi:uncharacterized protein